MMNAGACILLCRLLVFLAFTLHHLSDRLLGVLEGCNVDGDAALLLRVERAEARAA
eukprot:CAMPEP_0168437874 /NCGR_PEP_ID=MMETSP0228-20121227/41667_1 /TAXON_ID=133427 /ORGANISM="Protoceratium reticulatum, Strain CCCM 535 (=CCMP 1889)" /LENGTH=55 /DNA_ID=CAMNT_0008452117 /DNA_START=290 /DNA_END=453 /DNA_ORIENTATION=-